MSGETKPAYEFSAITPSDSVILSYNGKEPSCRGIYVGTAGNIACKNSAGATVVFVGLLAGAVYPINTNQVMATNTTASNLIALF